MARTNPLQFIQQVRAEAAKVSWPSRREVGLTTLMVMIMAAIFATFFFLVDIQRQTRQRSRSSCPLGSNHHPIFHAALKASNSSTLTRQPPPVHSSSSSR